MNYKFYNGNSIIWSSDPAGTLGFLLENNITISTWHKIHFLKLTSYTMRNYDDKIDDFNL